MDAMPRVLLVEDQKRLLGSLQRGLQEEGYEVLVAPTGEEGFYLATTQAPDAVVLDLMHSRIYGGDFPDTTYRDLFRMFLL